ncbi:hypothetical protein M5689_005959 [Euphorbia peplus]|nr:hypothetical protein M5689_005959 [Euphorbia peplus]
MFSRGICQTYRGTYGEQMSNNLISGLLMAASGPLKCPILLSKILWTTLFGSFENGQYSICDGVSQK